MKLFQLTQSLSRDQQAIFQIAVKKPQLRPHNKPLTVHLYLPLENVGVFSQQLTGNNFGFDEGALGFSAEARAAQGRLEAALSAR